MFELAINSKAVKYDVLTKWLKTKIENDEELKVEDLELMLLSLGVEIKHKCQYLESKVN